jgi:transcriptional regulator with XRE-family HTH domain
MKKQTRIKLGDQVREAVRQSGLSQYRLSQLLGIGMPHLSRFLSGHAGLSMDALDRLAELLDLNITGPGPGAVKATDYPDRRRIKGPRKGK